MTKRGLTWLALAGLGLAGCSGGGGDDGDRDRTAPVVTISGNSNAVQAGDAVDLTVSATDNVDGPLTYTLSCTGGTLAGTRLTVPQVDATQSIECTATATDAAGNQGTGSFTLQVSPLVASLEAWPGMATLKPGQFGVLVASNLPLEDAEYEATLDGQPVTLYRTDDGGHLAFAMPLDASTGAHDLSVQVGSRSYTRTFEVVAAPEIADPKATVVDYLTARRDDLAAFLASDGATIGAAASERIAGYIATIDAGLAAVEQSTSAELADAAAYLVVNGLGGGVSPALASLKPAFGAPAQASSPDDRLCRLANNNLAFAVGATIAAMGVGAKAAWLATTPLGLAIGAAGVAAGAIALKFGVFESIDQIQQYCIDDPLLALLPEETAAAQKLAAATGTRFAASTTASTSLGFRNKVARNFKLQRKRSMLEAFVGSVLASAQRLRTIGESIGWVPQSILNVIAVAEEGIVDFMPASQVGLGAITGGQVTGSLAGSGETLALKFQAIEPTEENIPFGFSLLPADSDVMPVDATLTLDLPEADDAALQVIQGNATTSMLGVRGQESLEVVQSPAHGALSLGNDGAYTYTPSGQYFGSDVFKYRARNEDGVSRVATVTVSVVRKFDGAWLVTSTSKTTSQSQAGLCPDEESTFTIGVSKASATLYLVNYEGVQLELRMSSADDPSGLSGSKTVTYEDGPGETTESLSVSIPDSSTVHGSGSWSYDGPEGTFCTGVTTVTGRRP